MFRGVLWLLHDGFFVTDGAEVGRMEKARLGHVLGNDERRDGSHEILV